MAPLRFLAALLATLFVVSSPLAAQTPAPAPASAADAQADAREKEIGAALVGAFQAAANGPASVYLGLQGKIALPAGYSFVPLEPASRLMRAFGNRPGPNFLGLLLPTGNPDGWITTVDFVPAGYIKDDDAKNWNAAELLEQLTTGTEEANAERRSAGFPEITVAGWVEPPSYDAATHRLIWSALARQKGAAPEAPATVNYNTYALGREGFYQLNLITSNVTIETDKPHAKALLAALAYDPGKRYEDFNPATDRVAEYGLAALIAGAAAKKLGLFALIGVMLLKFWKIAALGLFAVVGILPRLFRRSKS